jgi:hypothetical protein
MVLMKSDGTVSSIGSVNDIFKRSSSDPILRAEMELAGVIQSQSSTSAHVSKQPISEIDTQKSQDQIVISSTNVVEGRAIKRMTKDESLSSTRVPWKVYKFYLQSAGSIGSSVFMVGSIFLAYGLGFFHDYALKNWSQSSRDNNEESAAGSQSDLLFVYGLAALFALISLQLRYIGQILFSMKASSKMHAMTLESLLHAPLSFFESTPSGRILNRFGKDFQVVDQEVVQSVGETVTQTIHACAVGKAADYVLITICIIQMTHTHHSFSI